MQREAVDINRPGNSDTRRVHNLFRVIYPCLRCGGEYDQPRRRASHFCPDCRLERRREESRERMRRIRAAARDTGLIVNRVDNGDYLPTLREIAVLDDGDPAMVIDRPPAGANSTRGPDEGVSTTNADLAAVLHRKAAEAAAHPWFAANPHWSYALHDEDEARQYRLVERPAAAA